MNASHHGQRSQSSANPAVNAPDGPFGVPAPLALADLWEQLVWPTLLRAPALALRPARVGLALVFLLGVAVIVSGVDLIDGVESRNVLGEYLTKDGHQQVVKAVEATQNLHTGLAVKTVYRMFVSGPGTLLARHPWMMIVAVPLLLTWTAVMGGAISRMAACDHALGLRITWPQGLGFAAGRWMSLLGAMSIPLVLIWLKCLALAVAAWALFSVPVLDVLGGAAWGLFLLGGAVVAVIALAYLFGHGMLIPVVTCDGADAIDAIQHTYAYVLAKPVRLLIYLFVLVVQAIVIAFIASTIVGLVQDVTHSASLEWATERGSRILDDAPKLEGTARASAWFVRLWSAIPGLLLTAYFVSLYWCSATMLYLCMRRICDAQDPSEIWMPGTTEGTVSVTSTATTN